MKTVEAFVDFTYQSIGGDDNLSPDSSDQQVLDNMTWHSLKGDNQDHLSLQITNLIKLYIPLTQIIKCRNV